MKKLIGLLTILMCLGASSYSYANKLYYCDLDFTMEGTEKYNLLEFRAKYNKANISFQGFPGNKVECEAQENSHGIFFLNRDYKSLKATIVSDIGPLHTGRPLVKCKLTVFEDGIPTVSKIVTTLLSASISFNGETDSPKNTITTSTSNCVAAY